jgi:hypothetical protein
MESKLGRDLFCEHARLAIVEQPGLRLDDAEPTLAGTVKLIAEDGVLIDEYEVRIEYRPGYPEVFPFVFETGGKIPVNIDWHVYESDGHLCLCTSTDEYIKAAGGLALAPFIKAELLPYLFNQTHRRLTGFFLQEMAHGEQGELATLKMLLKTPLLGNVRWILLKIINGFHQDRTSVCFCGSKLKYRYCHRGAIDQLRRVRMERLMGLVKMVENSQEFAQQNLLIAK